MLFNNYDFPCMLLVLLVASWHLSKKVNFKPCSSSSSSSSSSGGGGGGSGSGSGSG